MATLEVLSSRPARRWWMRVEPWLAASLLAILVPGFLLARRPTPGDAPPVLGKLAPFTLVRESGGPLSSDDLRGKVWVADFVFLGCSEACPLLTTRMGHLQGLLVEEGEKRGAALPVRLVTFTVDPTNDTAERLADYAARWHADPAVWAFATGGMTDVQHVVGDGFKIAFGKVESGAGAFEMMHGNYFVLVDGQMNLRGYYSTDHADEMAHLVQDVVRLADALPAGAIASKAGGA